MLFPIYRLDQPEQQECLQGCNAATPVEYHQLAVRYNWRVFADTGGRDRPNGKSVCGGCMAGDSLPGNLKYQEVPVSDWYE